MVSDKFLTAGNIFTILLFCFIILKESEAIMDNRFLDLAIQREIEAHDFYINLAEFVTDKTANEALLWIAAEETRHREFLENYRDGTIPAGTLRLSEVEDLKIAEHVAAPELNPKIETKDIYLIAAHRELASYNFYIEFAKLHTDDSLRDIILKIANEELKHKEKVEYLYTNTAFPQTAGG